MKQLLTAFAMGVVLVGFVAAGLGMQEPPREEATLEEIHATVLPDREFIGVAKCRTCHRKAESGEQFQKWEESGHAKAFQTLGTPEAKKIAAAKGIDDPQASGECLQCHVTAFGVAPELLGEKHSIEDGVGCESCHGAGGDYYKKSTMTSITAGEIDGATVGLVRPDAEVCVTCHNEKSPSYKPFDFDKSAAKIAHPIPEETKAAHKSGG